MTIRSTEATELIGVSSPAAASASLHKMVMADSMMSMEPVASLPIPAHGAVELKPGTYHVMLIGLKHRLAPGSSVPLILTFRGVDRVERSITVQAGVSELAAETPGTKM
jgi:copper(I)-binding protein